jgi:hypothetical protein
MWRIAAFQFNGYGLLIRMRPRMRILAVVVRERRIVEDGMEVASVL